MYIFLLYRYHLYISLVEIILWAGKLEYAKNEVLSMSMLPLTSPELYQGFYSTL